MALRGYYRRRGLSVIFATLLASLGALLAVNILLRNVFLLKTWPFLCIRPNHREHDANLHVKNRDLVRDWLANPPDFRSAKANARGKYTTILGHIEKKCREYELHREEAQALEERLRRDLGIWSLKRFWHAKQYGFSYCPLSAAGSATFTQFFIKLLNDNLGSGVKMKNFRTVLREKYYAFPNPANPSPNATEKVIVWTMVRHPFSRLSSGYFNRMLRNWSDPKAGKGAKFTRDKILLDSRGSDFDLTTEDNPSPSEFASFLIRESRLKGAHRLDLCFQPMWVACAICGQHVHFDAIAKTETLNNDLDFLIRELLGLHDILEVRYRPRPWADSKVSTQPGDQDKALFSQLTKAQIEDLYELYKRDFELFDYPYPQEFLNLAIKDEL